MALEGIGELDASGIDVRAEPLLASVSVEDLDSVHYPPARYCHDLVDGRAGLLDNVGRIRDEILYRRP